MVDKKELQRKYLQLQILRQQMTAMLEEKAVVEERINELSSTIDSLKKLHSIKTSEEMWSSLGSGSFVRAEIKDTEKVVIGIGAGIFAKKSAGDAAETLEGRLKELNTVNDEIMAELNKINIQLLALEPEVEKLAGQQSA
ncbi:MAG: prefoldin subunit alpha [Candidatus Aenigmarchaeota archaeon]|nr:prefoldin subunit alpha [Candidatus Aenigmarchaeota archaeon]